MIITRHFYTVTYKGRRYAAVGPYRWADAEKYFGVPRSQLKRGADMVGLDLWDKKLLKEEESGVG